MRKPISEVQQVDKTTATEIAVLALVALLPLVGAQFGLGNQAEQIAIITRISNPDLLNGDFFTDGAARLGQPRFYYATIISWLAGLTSLPFIIHSLSVLMNFLLGFVTFRAARQFLAASKQGAMIAATLAMINASFHLGFAGYLRFDSFQPANIAIPVALFGFVSLLSGHYWRGAVLGILASIFHPAIGAEVILISFGAVAAPRLLLVRNIRDFASLIPLAGACAFFLAGVFVLWGLPNLGADNVRLSSEEFYEIYAEFRVPHHLLGLTFSSKAWLEALLFSAALAVVMTLHALQKGLTQSRIAFGFASLAVIVLCVTSLWFVDIAHNRMWVSAQVFRMILVLKWVAFVYFGWAAGHWIAKGKLPELLVVAAAIVASADANPYVVVLALVVWALFRLVRPSDRIKLIAAVAFVLAAAVLDKKYGVDKQSLRAIIAVSVLALVYILPIRKTLGLGMAGALVAVSLTGAVAMREQGILGLDSLRSLYSWSDLTDDRYAITRRAREISPEGAIWIVPPSFEVFVALAQRPIVVNFNAIPFEDAAMREWRDRLDVLFGPTTRGGFAALDQMTQQYRKTPRLALAARKYGASYAVLFAETPWDGEVLAQNDTYKAIRIVDD